jgi:hypothetical protein
MTPQSAKGKGRRLQQWARDKVLLLFPDLEPDDVRSTSMGAGGEDVLLSPAARKLFPFSVECKNLKAIAAYKFYEQAKANCPKGSEPLVVMKQNNSPPLVLVSAEWFFKQVRW